MEPLVLRASMHSRLSELHEFPSSALASVVPYQPALKLRLGWQRRTPSIHLHFWLMTATDTKLCLSLNLLTSQILSTLVSGTVSEALRKSHVLFFIMDISGWHPENKTPLDSDPLLFQGGRTVSHHRCYSGLTSFPISEWERTLLR